MTRKILLLLLLLINARISVQGMAARRSIAERCALAFVHKRKIMGSLMLAWQTDNYFVFNVSGGGWVAVTDGESSNSVLAYSDSGSLQVGTMPKSTMAWFDVLDKRLEVVGERPRKTKYDRPSIAPLITSEWGQREPYNMFIPMVEDVFHPENGWVHALTGCVATAVSQIMRYHRWPQDTCCVDSEVGNLHLKTYFEWDLMHDGYEPNDRSESACAVAQLMYDVGRTIHSSYSIGGTGASDIEGIFYLVRHFGYSPLVRCHNYRLYSDEVWDSIVYQELAVSRPVMICGGDKSGQGKHAFICDGYDSDGFFHLNWGWGGIGNGYYRFASMAVDYNDRKLDFQKWHAFTGIRKRTADEDSLLDVLTCHEVCLLDSFWHRDMINADFPKFEINFVHSNYTDQSNKGVDCAIGLFRNGMLVSNIQEWQYQESWVEEYRWDIISLGANLPDGTYQLKLLWRHNNQEEWRLAQYAEENSVTLTIKGNVMWVSSMENMPASVKDIPICKLPQDAIYDLHGRRLLQQPARGVYIENGRKKLGR